MIVVCPGCGKKLKIPDGAAGKKARCPGCAKVVTVPGEPVAAPAPPNAGRASSAETAPATAANAPASGMRCAACKAPGIEALPPDKFSRRPGYACPGCGAKMRPPGSIGGYVFAIALGGFTTLLGLAGLVIGVFAGGNDDLRVEGGLMIMILGATVISWCVYQLRLPAPLDAPAQPSRIGFWLLILLIGLLAIGAAVFGFMYYLHEML